MILFRMIGILSIVFFTAYANEKLNDIDAKIKECHNHNGSACYELGQYYSQNSEENSTNQTFYFYEKGCASKHDESCIQETEWIRKENKKAYDFYSLKCVKNAKCVPNIFAHKYENIGDIYYKKEEYKIAYEKYMLSATYVNPDATFKISTIYLKGEGVLKDINISKKFYIHSVRQTLQNLDYHFGRKMFGQVASVKIKFDLLADGSIVNLQISESSKNIELDNKIIESIKSLPKFHTIPKEYNAEILKFEVPVKIWIF